MISCLENLIGFRVCGYTASESGIYIDDMPAGAIARMQALTDPERVDAGEIWTKIRNRASARFASDIRKALPYRLKTADILSNAILAERDPSPASAGGTGKWQGVMIKVHGTPLMRFTLNWVRLWLSADGTVPVKVYDLQTGDTLYSKDFDGVAGENVFTTSFDIPVQDYRRDFFIAFDDTGLSTYQTRKVTDRWCHDHGVSQYASVSAGSTSSASPLVADITTSSQSGGLIPSVSLRCGMDGFICQNRMTLAQAFCLLAVVELYREILEGDGVMSKWTIQNPDETRQRIAEYTEQYGNELTGVLANLTVSDPVCIECQHPISVQYVTG